MKTHESLCAGPAVTSASTHKAPPAWVFMLEGRALFEATASSLCWPWLASAPRGDGHPILIVPGFMQGPPGVLPLQHFLSYLGYDAQTWDQGLNPGLRESTLPKLQKQLQALAGQQTNAVTLIGWSLGGVFARVAASLCPTAVRQVITLGAPFAGDPAVSSLAWLYKLANGRAMDEVQPGFALRAREPLPMPTTAIYSRTDGVVPWQHCVDDRSLTHHENIEVVSSHGGYGHHPIVKLVIADRLRQSSGRWRPLPLVNGQPLLSALLPGRFCGLES
jgi:dienelactone hydrolase